MKFEQYQQIKAHALAACTAAGLTYGEPKQLNPILLAYIGDVVFFSLCKVEAAANLRAGSCYT